MAFISKIARNLSLKRLEFLKREKRSANILLSLEELEAVLPDDRYAPNINDDDVAKSISKFLKAQKEDSRKVFIRKYYFFDSINTISKRFGFTESKVKNMLFNTRNKLKEYLIKEGVEI
jgi:RNA polymerase sigma-70 factor (ECF subfamily)